MTEVALGLSMAFFALLVVALVSIGLKQEDKQVQAQLALESTALDLQEDKAKKPAKEQQVVFYIDNKFLDEKGQSVLLDSLSRESSLVLGIPPDLSAKDLVELQSQIKVAELEITLLSQEWMSYFENLNRT